MAENFKTRGAIKFVFYLILCIAVGWYWVNFYESGDMARWYYHTSKVDGYAINAKTFAQATKDKPISLEIGKFDTINGLQAVQVKKGDRLPSNANGVIDEKVLKEGKRAVLEGNKIKVLIPWQIKEAKGFKFRDTFTHKGVLTNPWSAVWNVVMVISFGLCLGFMAEGFTDLLGIKLKKIQHYGH
ncbi:MAG: hypothetical protein HQK55_06925 [Deltaproteobacteria bacterium]|nr:hypothetical protein [Deltaproteobacteria bacterium]